MDYAGPVGPSISENTVELDDPPAVLSPHDKEQLSRILSDMEVESPDQAQPVCCCTFFYTLSFVRLYIIFMFFDKQNFQQE